MDFLVSDDLAAHRAAARRWADEHVRPEWLAEQLDTGCYQTVELHRLLAKDGFLGAGWPAAAGGSDVDPHLARAVYDEIASRGLHADGWATTLMVVRTVDAVGTEEQKREYVAGALRGEVLIALGYTEPDSGSDVAAAKTTAVRDGDGWLINGQKMFTSTAQVCSHVFVLARTNPAAPKHQGLSLFLVPTDSPGFACHPIHTLGGQTTNSTYYTDVRVPASALIGDVDAGWSVMNVALVFERGVGRPTSFEEPLSAELVEWARDAGALDDASVAERIGRAAVDEEVARLLGSLADWKAAKGELTTTYGAMRKLFQSEAWVRNCDAALDLLGPGGVLQGAGAPGEGWFERSFRGSVVKTVYGGASEVLRDIIAQRHLGLPRNRPAATA